ncbi:MAG: tetratricopeptide repeat protein [Bacteroidota bacterium]
MASLIPGFEYDIFISYRQKDNKGDGWVTEFVEALKTELEATFKEDISVYFDVNPHDGLLETHDVAASLKEKLKALVFIPIVSRTYCDPNSYAWEHEFVAFIEQASQDRFGLKVKLPGGNVASRVLPIRIHDLEPEDIKLAESYLGFIRPVDFIYHSQGVNRPLRLRDDDLAKPSQQLVYRDQINKVANAIKEIINGLIMGAAAPEKEKIPSGEPFDDVSFVKKGEESKEPEKMKSSLLIRRKPLLWTAAIGILVIIAAILTYPKIFNRSTPDKLQSSDGKISVAVMPFRNMTNDTTWNVWQDGIQNLLITSLSNSGELKVRQPESITSLLESKGITDYASITPSAASSISQKLDADVFIYGSINQAGGTIRVNTQLIDSKTEEIVKSLQMEAPSGEQMIFHITDTLSEMIKNHILITELSREQSYETQQSITTNSPQAYRYLIYGKKSFNNRDYATARSWFQQAIAADSNLTIAAIFIAISYSNQGLYEPGRKWCLRVYEKKDSTPLELKLLIYWLYAVYFETPHEQVAYLKQLLEMDDYRPLINYIIGDSYSELHQYDKAIPSFEKALELRNEWGLKPTWIYNYTELGKAYHKTGMFNKEKTLYKKAEKDFPDDPVLLYNQAVLSLTEKDMAPADRYIEKYMSARKWNSVPEATILTGVASIYSDAGIPDKAENYYRQALTLEPDNSLILNNLAFFLIDLDRNIDEGLVLVNKALELSPDDHYCLDTRGWGLYKQGKYQEALAFLEKSWKLKPVYDHDIFVHLQEVRKALAGQKKN